MAEITDIDNEFIQEEIREYIERPDEIERIVGVFANASSDMQEIAAALIEGDHGTVDELTREAVDADTPALEVMDYGLIAGMAIVGRISSLCPKSWPVRAP